NAAPSWVPSWVPLATSLTVLRPQAPSSAGCAVRGYGVCKLLLWPGVGQRRLAMAQGQEQEKKQTLPPQHQEQQPGIEAEMTPRPVAEDPKLRGSGKLAG